MKKLSKRECEKLIDNKNIAIYQSESDIPSEISVKQIGYNKEMHIGLYLVDSDHRVLVVKKNE